MPEGIVDVIPVDLVVAAIIAVAAGGPARRRARRSSRWRRARPTRCEYRTLVDLVQDWFTEHPLYDTEGQPIVVPEWSFPGRGQVQGQLRAGQDGHRPGREGAAAAAPAGQAGRVVGPPREPKREEAERALGYVELYGAYAECEAIYGVDRLLALWDALDEADQQATSASTPGSSTGPTTSSDVHLPVGRAARPGAHHARRAHRRGRDDPPAPPGARPRAPPRRVRPGEHAHRLQRGGVLLVAGHPPPAPRGPAALRRCAPCARRPSLLALDRTDRSDFLRHFYRRYEGAPVEPARRGRRRAVQRPAPDQVVPGRHPPGARAPRRSATARCSSPAPSTSPSSPLRPLFDDVVVRRAWRSARRHATPAS